MKCPKCGIENNDNWPIVINGKSYDGGCQLCWEKQIDAERWGTVSAAEVVMTAIDMEIRGTNGL